VGPSTCTAPAPRFPDGLTRPPSIAINRIN
jgi:hypothetical protein